MCYQGVALGVEVYIFTLSSWAALTIGGTGLPPCMEDIIENLKGHSFYFIADLKSGYDTILLKDESQDLTAFHVYN